jgi:hypothetical protein
MLLAEIVGNAGSVFAIDRESRAVEIARAHAAAADTIRSNFMSRLTMN